MTSHPVDTVLVRVRKASLPFPRQRVAEPRPPGPAPLHFEERRVGTAAVLTLAWLLVLGIVIGVAVSASLLTVARHTGLDPAGPGQGAGLVSRAAWHLSR